jgi:hypothetical protein
VEACKEGRLGRLFGDKCDDGKGAKQYANQ